MRNGLKCIDLWNQLTTLSRPSLGQIEQLIGAEAASVYSHAPNFLYLGNNLLVKLPIGKTRTSTSPVASLTLVFVANYFASKTDVATDDLNNLEMFGLSLSNSAEGFLNLLKLNKIGPINLITEIDGWTIGYGKSLLFKFSNNEIAGADPNQSKLKAITFSYLSNYSGRPPLLSSVNKIP